MFVSTLTSDSVVTSTINPSLQAALLRNNAERARPVPPGSLPPLSLVPEWIQLLPLPSEGTLGLPALQTWRIELTRAPVRRLDVREIYLELAQLPRLDRVGRFAHIDFPMPGLSTGPELFRLAPDPPREDYPRAQELTPGWSLWYKPSGDRWAIGIATGTRFLIAQQSSTVVDPFTSETRWAFFLP